MQAEYERQIRILQAENARLYERSIKAEAQRDAAYDKITEMRRETYQLAVELEEEKGKNQKLIAQISKDFENSSLPSSAQETCQPDEEPVTEGAGHLRPVHQEKENP